LKQIALWASINDFRTFFNTLVAKLRNLLRHFPLKAKRRSESGFFRPLLQRLRTAKIPPVPLTILLACVIGVIGGYGAVFFTFLIEFITRWTVEPVVDASTGNHAWLVMLPVVPAVGLLAVSWFTRRFAPEAQGHGVPEVITAVARHDGVIRPRVSLVKILASGVCIGTGGSVGREGPIVQIGSSLGSMAGQWSGLSPRHIKILVAAGAAAGISATFNAPLAGVIFASEIILGNFAVETLTPIVIASVLADVVKAQSGGHGWSPAFQHLHYAYRGAWAQLPFYVLLGLFCGLAAVSFTKLLYAVEDFGNRWFAKWWVRALLFGALVGLAGALYPMLPPSLSPAAEREVQRHGPPLPPLFGVGYGVVDHALRLENERTPSSIDVKELAAAHHVTVEDLAAFLNVPAEKLAGFRRVTVEDLAAFLHMSVEGLAETHGVHVEELTELDKVPGKDKIVKLNPTQMLAQLWWLLPLALLKPLMTSLALGGGGSGGIFAPSLYLGATLGASFGLVCELLVPGWTANPGVYAIVGMGAVVAGTTHGTLSAILIVYEMTGDYRIILPIMVAAGLSGVVARLIDPDSIYLKKLFRREESIARAHDVHRLEHVMVRDMMRRDFPSVRQTDNLDEIARVARANPDFEVLPVMNEDGRLVSVIRPGDLQRALDTDAPPQLIKADDIALMTPVALSIDANLLEALRDFGASDTESLPVESGRGRNRRLVGILLRSDVMRRYREEMLRRY